MHIWDDKPSSTAMHHKVPAKKMDYSHCPLKKRPVNFVKYIKEEMDFDNNEEYAEPENLSTKPQDLSVKCKANIAATALDVKKESQSPYQQQHVHHHQYNQNVGLPSPPPSLPYQHPQYPYQPTAVKPGPLEPLCLNIAGEHHPMAVHAPSAVPPYHHHNRLHYAPAAPRPVPAQYPGTGYLAGYMYHHHHGGLAAERPFPAAATVYPPSMVSRAPSLSPPGSGGSGSAFKPLHASPPSTATVASCSPPAMTWYGRAGGWSPSTADVSPPLPSSSSSLSAISPPYGPPAQLPPQSYQQHCSSESDASSTVAGPCSVIRKPPSSGPAVPATSADRYKCHSCAKTYLTVAGLTKHHQYHCSDDECAGTAAAAKTFSCKYCDKAYNTLGALKMHIRTHTLPCICKLCGKAFSRPWLLQGHIRTHTGEKPFSCQHCNRAFADRSNLRAHLQTHSDVKKYSCPTCSKTFSRMSLLTKHCDTGCPRLQPQQQQTL